MRIVNRAAFLALPPGTVFVKFPAQPKGGSPVNLSFREELAIKEKTVGEDFTYQSLFPWFEGINHSEEWKDTMKAMIGGAASPPVDYDCATADRHLNKDQLFAVWSREDLNRLIDRLLAARSKLPANIRSGK